MSSTPLNQTNKSEVNQKMVEAANCRHCFLTGGAALGIPMLKCSRCGTAYCSKDCQVKDWPEHKKRCKIWAEVKNLNPNTKTMTKCYEDWSMLYSPTRLVLLIAMWSLPSSYLFDDKIPTKFIFFNANYAPANGASAKFTIDESEYVILTLEELTRTNVPWLQSSVQPSLLKDLT